MDITIENWKESGQFITTTKGDDLQVFARHLGSPSAPPEKTLLIFHGFPESSLSYHLVIDGLQQHFERIVLFDFPGYGFSDKPQTGYSYSLLEQADVALEVWNHFGIKGGHLLAHDMADSVATELIAREVEKSLPEWFKPGFKSYTLTNGSMVLSMAKLRIMQKLLLTRYGKFFAKLSTKALFRQQVLSGQGNKKLNDTEIDRLWAMLNYNDGKSVLHLIKRYLFERKKFESIRWLPALANTKVPIHICWGKEDKVAKVDMAHYLQANVCPQATFTYMDGVGHFCQIDSPEIWLESILAFYN